MWGAKQSLGTDAQLRGRGPAWLAAIARGIVQLGVLLVIFGLGTAAYVLLKSQRGVEALATIDTASFQSGGMTSPGVLDLSWRDAMGAQRTEYGVKISSTLARKLRVGRQLSRQMVRIRYVPGEGGGAVTVVEDIPEMFNGAAMIALIGFGTVSFGSLLMLLALAWDGARARHLSVVRPDQSGASP